MKLRTSLFALALVAAAGCSSSTNANPLSAPADAFVDEDSEGAEDTGAGDETATDSATPDSRTTADSRTSEVAGECAPGSVENDDCGKCGKRTRTCSSGGSWLAWGACGSESGICAPAESRMIACGKCGTRSETCSTTCAWVAGTCSGEGACNPGDRETDTGVCTAKNVRTRTCTSTCAWSEWTCMPPKGWVDVATAPLTARYGHSAVWSGNEMIVWGGNPSLADGAAYSVATDTWRSLPAATSVPGFVGREGHTAVWTGSKMLIWGGVSTTLRNDGASYDAMANTWTALPATTLGGRQEHTAVWTGSEMIVWGGETDGFNTLADGAAYNPSTGWRTIAAVPAGFGARSGHRAVWAGGKMIVFGGFDYFSGFTAPRPNSCAAKTATSYCGDAAAYDPLTDKWGVLTPPTPALDPRQRSGGVATSSLAIFWGGMGNTAGGSQYRNSGAIFDTAASTWKAMTLPTESVFPGSKRSSMMAWSSGDTAFFWGGHTATSTTSATGASYDLATATWNALPALNAPTARALATVVWTGSEAIVWGGQGSSGTRNDGKIYRP